MPIPTTFFLSSLILDEIKKSWANQNLKKKKKERKRKKDVHLQNIQKDHNE